MPDPTPTDITLYFLNSSRAIRVAWLLEELNLLYTLVASDRAPNGLGPPEFKAKIPSPLGKSPTLADGDLVVVESGAIVEYLCEKYDSSKRLIPASGSARADVLAWIHASEATFAVHAMPILYARWNMPEAHRDALPELERGMSRNIHNDFNWLEGVLVAQKDKGSQWIVGDSITAADIMMQFRQVVLVIAGDIRADLQCRVHHGAEAWSGRDWRGDVARG